MSEFMLWFGGDTWTFIDALVTILTLSLVIWNLYQSFKQNKQIKIFIEKNKVKRPIPSYILRKNFVRSDIKGILKELHNSKEDYRIEYLINPNFQKEIFEIQKGIGDELVIYISENDFFVYENM